MASKKSVTLTKDGHTVTLTVPRDIVEYRAAGWREKQPDRTPVADAGHESTSRPAVGVPSVAPARPDAPKGETQK